MGLKQKSTLAQSLDKGKLNFTNQGQAIHKIIRCNARKEATLRSHHINPAYDHLIQSYDRFHGNLYGFLLTGMISLSMMSICCTILRYFSGVCLTPRVVVGVAPLSLYVNFTPPVSSGSLVIAAAVHLPFGIPRGLASTGINHVDLLFDFHRLHRGFRLQRMNGGRPLTGHTIGNKKQNHSKLLQ